MKSEVLVVGPLVLLLMALVLAAVVVFVVLRLRRRRPPRGFDVTPVLPLGPGELEVESKAARSAAGRDNAGR
jgi:hypothetical protein